MRIDTLLDLFLMHFRRQAISLVDASGRRIDGLEHTFALRDLAGLALDAVDASPRCDDTLVMPVAHLDRLLAETRVA